MSDFGKGFTVVAGHESGQVERVLLAIEMTGHALNKKTLTPNPLAVDKFSGHMLAAVSQGVTRADLQEALQHFTNRAGVANPARAEFLNRAIERLQHMSPAEGISPDVVTTISDMLREEQAKTRHGPSRLEDKQAELATRLSFPNRYPSVFKAGVGAKVHGVFGAIIGRSDRPSNEGGDHPDPRV